MALYRYNPGHLRARATVVLIALNVALAVADGFSGEAISRLFWARAFDVYYGDFWRPLSAGFAHANLGHIAMNMYSLFVLGQIVEPLYGTKRFLLIYFVSLLGGSALSLALSDPSTPMLGASGAIFGLFGALLGFLFARTGSWRGVWNTAYGRQLIIVLALNAYISLLPGISLLGHLGGFVPGLLLGIVLERRLSRIDSPADSLTFYTVLAGVLLLTAYSCLPLNRAGYVAIQALKAYEAGDIARGDELRAKAKDDVWAGQDGTQKLLTHLAIWRTQRADPASDASTRWLKLPLTHAAGLDVQTRDGPVTMPYTFLKPQNPDSASERNPRATD